MKNQNIYQINEVSQQNKELILMAKVDSLELEILKAKLQFDELKDELAEIKSMLKENIDL